MGIIACQLLSPDNIVSQDIDAHPRQHVSHPMLNQGVSVIGTPCQQDGQSPGFPRLRKDALIEAHCLRLVGTLCAQGFFKASGDDGRGYAQACEILLALLLKQFLALESDGGGINRDGISLHPLHHFRIAGDNGTIVTVVSVPLLLEDHERHEDTVHLLFLQIMDVAVHQLGRETNVVGHHHAGIALIRLVIRSVGQADMQAATCEEGVPERIILEHVQATGNADGQCSFGRGGRTVEEQFFFQLIGIDALRTVFPVGEDSFAAVA